jgi:hypothetical protein
MLNFKSLAMMELRSGPGEVLDRVARQGEAFVIERNGQQMACLVPLSVFMPDIQPARLNRELELLSDQKEQHSLSVNDQREMELHFRGEGAKADVTVTILLPHGYPNACPKIFAAGLPEKVPHRWQDGSLCVYGAMDVWNPGKHDVVHTLYLARRWLSNFAKWQRDGVWGGEPDVAE